MPRTLLVVDDSTTIQEAVRHSLAGEDWTVATASNEAEALKALKTCNPDVILCDAALDDEDGYQICRAIKAVGNPSPPVIMMGSQVRDSMAMAAGAAAIIGKPFSSDELINSLKNIVDQPAISFDFEDLKNIDVAELESTPFIDDQAPEPDEFSFTSGTEISDHIEIIDLSSDDDFSDLELLDDLQPVAFETIQPPPLDEDGPTPWDKPIEDSFAAANAFEPETDATEELAHEQTATGKSPETEYDFNDLMNTFNAEEFTADSPHESFSEEKSVETEDSFEIELVADQIDASLETEAVQESNEDILDMLQPGIQLDESVEISMENFGSMPSPGDFEEQPPNEALQTQAPMENKEFDLELYDSFEPKPCNENAPSKESGAEEESISEPPKKQSEEYFDLDVAGESDEENEQTESLAAVQEEDAIELDGGTLDSTLFTEEIEKPIALNDQAFEVESSQTDFSDEGFQEIESEAAYFEGSENHDEELLEQPNFNSLENQTLKEPAALGAFEFEPPAETTPNEDEATWDVGFDEEIDSSEETASIEEVNSDEDSGFDQTGHIAESVAESAKEAVNNALKTSLSPETLTPLIESAVERVVWEVVPVLAERLIREAIEKLRQGPPAE